MVAFFGTWRCEGLREWRREKGAPGGAFGGEAVGTETCEVKDRAGAREVASFAAKNLFDSEMRKARGNVAAKGGLIERAL